MDKILHLEQGGKYSDAKERYFMVPNWVFDEGDKIDLDVYERIALIYVIRLVNKRDNSNGKGDIFFLSAEHLSKKCGFSIGKAKLVLKRLEEHGYIKKISTGNNLTGKANYYKMMNLQPQYVYGIEVPLSEAEQKLSEVEYNDLLLKSSGVVYYYEEEGKYSHRKSLPLLVDCDTGEFSCFIDD